MNFVTSFIRNCFDLNSSSFIHLLGFIGEKQTGFSYPFQIIEYRTFKLALIVIHQIIHSSRQQ